jgi:DNA-binding response OmpR family regulator
VGEKILVVDDEREIAELVRDYLRAEGYEVVLAGDGEEAVNQYQKGGFQMAILDIMLPKKDGHEVCRLIRADSSIPILMLSARQSDVDKILGLGLGADDYVTKPFSPGELVARVKSHLRRYRDLSGDKKETASRALEYGKIRIDPDSYLVEVNGDETGLSAREFELLYFLATKPGRVYTRDQIFDSVWGIDDMSDLNTVTVHIRKIREKIEENPSHPQYIKTVWGVGYKFESGN